MGSGAGGTYTPFRMQALQVVASSTVPYRLQLHLSIAVDFQTLPGFLSWKLGSCTLAHHVSCDPHPNCSPRLPPRGSGPDHCFGAQMR